MEQQELIPHLFRTEFQKITAVLCRLLGIDQLDIAEDIAGETFLAALETWTYKGIPQNPQGWLYTVAKNKARNYQVRARLYANKIVPDLKHQDTGSEFPEIDLSEKNIKDSQLRMLFVVCHPAISGESQICLALRVLCGFGIEEIANALLTNKETVNKRLSRAKEKLRAEKVSIEFPQEEITGRLENVLTTLYLLFNEGYYSESNNRIIREELCLEAMRLTYQLVENESTNLPQVNALLALMCFQASRFAARIDQQGEIILYEDQDASLWNQELIAKGIQYLHLASLGKIVTTYHLEAGIAYWHTMNPEPPEKWGNILQLFNRLLQVRYSPVAALNRTYALAKVYGPAPAIKEAEKLQLNDNHYYFALLGELYREIDPATSTMNFEKAIELAKTDAERQVLRRKVVKGK